MRILKETYEESPEGITYQSTYKLAETANDSNSVTTKSPYHKELPSQTESPISIPTLIDPPILQSQHTSNHPLTKHLPLHDPLIEPKNHRTFSIILRFHLQSFGWYCRKQNISKNFHDSHHIT